jgi:TonB family protein
VAVAPRSADAAAPPAHPAEACSVITCIVNDYADPCCAMYRRPAAAGAPAPAPRADLPDSLDRAAIASGLGRIDARGCGQQSAAHGDVKVSVKVSPAGAVADVTVKSSPDPALDACVTAAVRKGAFPATQRGGSFAYVWRF